MTPKQHFRALQIRLEIAEFGMGMPLDRERVKELREQVEQARKDAANDNPRNDGYDISELDMIASDGVEP
jgi:hypothetical protein